MNKLHAALLITLSIGLAACGRDPTPATTSTDDGPQTMLGKAAAKGIEEARKKLAEQNLSLDGSFKLNGTQIGGKNDSSLPKGEITPAGDLLIDGKAVDITPEQREQLLAYRGQLLGVIEAGMAVGLKGADIAGKAITGSLGSILSGNTDEFEKKMEAEGKRIEAEAMQICAHLKPLLTAQDQLAASLPEFKPYARMTQEDIEDCGKDNGVVVFSNDDKTAVRDEIRSGIRDGIREAVRGAAQAGKPSAPEPPPAPTAPAAPAL